MSFNLFGETVLESALSNDKQNEYFVLAKKGDYNAKEIILKHNLRLVTFVINHYFNDLNEDNKKELFSVGCIELWNCIEKYNKDLKYKFSSFAIPSILGSIKRYLRENKPFHVPKNLLELSAAIMKLEEKNQNNHQLSTHELSNIFKVSEQKIILAKNINQQVIYLDCQTSESNNGKYLIKDSIPNPNFVIYDNLEKKELHNELKEALNKLPEKYKTILILLFGFDGKERKQKDVGKLLNLSESRISKIKKDALKKLKIALPKHIKDEYNQKKYSITKK